MSYLIGTNLFGVLANKMGRYVAWGSGKSQVGESSEVFPAPGMMNNSFSEVETLEQVHTDKNCPLGGWGWVDGKGSIEKGWS